VVYDHVKEGAQVRPLLIHLSHCPALAARGIHPAKVQLIVVCAELHKKIEDLIQDLVGTGVGTVHLVDHHHRLQVKGKSFLENKTGLGHGPLESIHQKQDPVSHLQDPFHLAPEVRMARGVDQVDACVLICNREVLGLDGDTVVNVGDYGNVSYVHDLKNEMWEGTIISNLVNR